MRSLNIGYTRVSTKEQAKEGYSLLAQHKAIENYFTSIVGKDKFEILEDDGYSGKNGNRPKYKELLNLIKEDKVGTIIVYKIDRISRNLLDFIELVNLCLEKEIDFISIVDGVNFNTSIGRCLANIIMSFAQMEREQISERTMFGIQEALEKGIYAIGGSLPLGIEKTEDKKLRYNEDIELVKEMFRLDKLGYSYAKISREIEKVFKREISQKNIDQIIKNPIYRGYRIFNGKKYYFIEPIVKEEENETTDIKGERTQVVNRKRNLKSHEYMFEKFLKRDFYLSTTRKKLSNGQIKEYKYYICKENSEIKINEETLMSKIKDKYLDIKEKIKENVNSYKVRVQKLYINEIITFEELNSYMNEVKDRTEHYSILESIKSLTIHNNRQVEVQLMDELLTFQI